MGQQRQPPQGPPKLPGLYCAAVDSRGQMQHVRWPEKPRPGAHRPHAACHCLPAASKQSQGHLRRQFRRSIGPVSFMTGHEARNPHVGEEIDRVAALLVDRILDLLAVLLLQKVRAP